MDKDLVEDVELKNYDNEPDEPVEEATEEAAEEVVEEAVEAAGEPKEEKNWMHQAMHEERERRKEIQRELEASRQQMQKMEERFQQLIKKKEEPAEPPPPSFDESPALNLKARVDAAEKQLKQAQEWERQQMEAATQQQYHQQFVGEFEGIEREYAKSRPDYYEAIQYLGKARVEEYMTLGLSQQQAMAAAHNDALAIAYNTRQQGKSGPEVFYELAKKRGFKGGAQPQKAVAEVEALARHVQESTSLGTSGGKDGDLSLKALADMDDEDFMKATSGERWRKLWE